MVSAVIGLAFNDNINREQQVKDLKSLRQKIRPEAITFRQLTIR
jgi:hypothetical protein